MKQAFLGTKIRRLRKEAGHTQVQLARMLGISASYLNLIERNQRALTVPLLLKIAEIFQLDLKSFAEDDEGRLVASLKEIFSDPLFGEDGIPDSEIRDIMAHTPRVTKALLRLYSGYRKSKEDAQTLAARLSDGERLFGLERSRLPSEEVSDLIQENRNYFPGLEQAAEELWNEAALQPSDVYGGLVRYLREALGIEVAVVPSGTLEGAVRRYSPRRRRLALSEALPPESLTFQTAHQIGLLTRRAEFDRIIASAELSTEDSKRLCRVGLANYFAGALLMPYDRFLEAARAVRYDIELLQHRFRASFEQVCHRLTSLNRPEAPGTPFHLVRVDVAGNISKRFSGSGIPFARYSGACPRWNVHAAFMTPGFIRTQLSEMTDGTLYFSVARTVRKAGGGHRIRQNRFALELGCRARYAKEIIYADGVDLENRNAAVKVGVSCRLCERMDCRQRAFPPMHHQLNVDENVRGLSFYYSPGKRGAVSSRGA